MSGQGISDGFVATGSLSDVSSSDEVWLVLDDRGALFPEDRIEGPARGKRLWKREVNRSVRSFGTAFSLSLLLVGGEGQRRIAEWRARAESGGMESIAGSRTLDEVSDLQPTRCEHEPIRTGSVAGVAQITSVKTAEGVPEELDRVIGTYRPAGVPRAKIWVFVSAADGDRFYPQTHRDQGFRGDLSAELLSDGRFRSVAVFGGRPGEQFELTAVLADAAASRSLSRTLDSWIRTGDYTGLTAEQLPAGLEERDCVPVRRR